ncbi:MAG: MerR family transcriptional regulator [Turicibacter sp.]
MEKLFSIGEVSKMKDITIKALRYYHKMGILIPRYIDENTGYRYYSIDQFIYMDVIKGCRAMGTSIAELQEIFKECETDKLINFLQLKKEEAKENINKMNEVIKNIETLTNSVETSKAILNNEEIEIKQFNQRQIIVAPFKEEGSFKELLYYSDLDKIIKEKNLEIKMDRGIIYTSQSAGDIEPKYVFNEIHETQQIPNDSSIKMLPQGNYLTVAYSKENEEACKQKILNYATQHQLNIPHIIELELYNDFFNTQSYSCQIQIYLGGELL